MKNKIVMKFIMVVMLGLLFTGNIAVADSDIQFISPSVQETDSEVYVFTIDEDPTVWISWIQPEESELTYSITEIESAELIDADVVESIEGGEEKIGFSSEMFEPGEVYQFELISENYQTGFTFTVEFQNGKRIESSSANLEENETDTELPAIILVSPEDGAVINTDEVKFITVSWILDNTISKNVRYDWTLEDLVSKEEILHGSGNMSKGTKNGRFEIPTQSILSDRTYIIHFSLEDEKADVKFDLTSTSQTESAKVPEATPNTLSASPIETPVPTTPPQVIIESVAKSLAIPESYISRVLEQKNTTIIFAALLNEGEIESNNVLSLMLPHNHAIVAYHERLSLQVAVKALRDIEDSIQIICFNEQNEKVYSTEKKGLKKGKQAVFAVPCRYFDATEHISVHAIVNGETLISNISFEPFVPNTPRPEIPVNSEITDEENVSTEDQDRTDDEVVKVTEISSDSDSDTGTDNNSFDNINIKAFQGKIKTHRDGSINVRKAPDAKSEKIGWLKASSVVTCTGITDNGWYQVVLRNGQVGYISKNLASIQR